jgi:hypothetical protein
MPRRKGIISMRHKFHPCFFVPIESVTIVNLLQISFYIPVINHMSTRDWV